MQAFKIAEHAFVFYYNCLYCAGGQVEVRGGQLTREFTGVSFAITNPQDRNIFTQERGHKPMLNFAEFMWYMTGNPSASVIAPYLPRWTSFADNDGNVASNYGVQWLKQIPLVIEELKRDRTSRRAVVTMYDGDKYLGMPDSKDIPCTVSIQFLIRDNRLDMVVNMRSNDLWWGFCNDQFAFSILQELIANELDVSMGVYFHNAGSFHLYERHWGKNISVLFREERITQPTFLEFSNFWNGIYHLPPTDGLHGLARLEDIEYFNKQRRKV